MSESKRIPTDEAERTGPNLTLIRVFEIPPPDGRYTFGRGNRAPFVEVDWFHDALGSGVHFETIGERKAHSITTDEGRAALEKYIREKQYFREDRAYLVLCPLESFTINYDASRPREPETFLRVPPHLRRGATDR